MLEAYFHVYHMSTFYQVRRSTSWIAHPLRGSISAVGAIVLLQAGVDITLIALWLGHESTATTHMYVEADLTMKERALNSVQPPHTKQTRYQPTDRVLHFLETL